MGAEVIFRGGTNEEGATLALGESLDREPRLLLVVIICAEQ